MTLVKRTWSFWLCLFLAAFLFIGSALTPPPFEIHNSIFTAVAWIFAFAVLGQLRDLLAAIAEILREGKSIKVTKGDFETEITAK